MDVSEEDGAVATRIEDALRSVFDPEIPVNVVDLGLVYEVKFADGHAEILMTLTMPGCPIAPLIESEVRNAVSGVAGVSRVSVTFTFDPPWSVRRITERGRAELARMGFPLPLY